MAGGGGNAPPPPFWGSKIMNLLVFLSFFSILSRKSISRSQLHGVCIQLKNRSFRSLFFFDIVTTQYDHPRYVKHVLGCIYVFFTLFVVGCGEGQTGLVHNLLMQFFSVYSSKIVPKLIF